MDKRRPIESRVSAGGGRAPEAEAAAERFKEALARWASTVTVFAVRDRDTGSVHAPTVTSFAPAAAYPPLVVVSLSPRAQALPFVEVGGSVGITLLAESQSRWASTFADSYPVGPQPWTDEGTPVIPGAAAALRCTVEEIHATTGGGRLVVCRVHDIELGEEDHPLLYWKREYRKLGDG